jgi:hypothetical protein
MQITVWSVTSKTELGIETTVHRHKLGAYQELKRCCCNTNEDNEIFDRHLAEGTFKKLMDWLIALCEPRGDYYSVDSHMVALEGTQPVTDADPLPSPVPAKVCMPADPVLDQAYRQAAADEYADGVRVEPAMLQCATVMTPAPMSPRGSGSIAKTFLSVRAVHATMTERVSMGSVVPLRTGLRPRRPPGSKPTRDGQQNQQPASVPASVSTGRIDVSGT